MALFGVGWQNSHGLMNICFANIHLILIMSLFHLGRLNFVDIQKKTDYPGSDAARVPGKGHFRAKNRQKWPKKAKKGLDVVNRLPRTP